MNDPLLCNSCKKEFSTKYTLKTHLERNKKCIKERGLEITSKYVCKSCNHISMQKMDFQIHLKNCTKYALDLQRDEYDEKADKIRDELEKKLTEKEDIIQKLEEELEKKIREKDETISKLEAKLEKFENTITAIASKGHTVTHMNHTENLVINNYLDLTKENMKQVISEHLTPAVVSMGQVGLARMVYQKFLKGPDGVVKYKTADPSRQTFEYVNKDGEVIKDVKAHKLTSAIVDAGNLSEKAGESGKKLWIKEDGSIDGHKFELNVMKVTDIINLELDNSKFRSELTALAT